MLYLECASGISGDMTVAALLDAGASEDVLRRALDSLPVEGFSVQVRRVQKSGLDACDFAVLLDDAHENHDHDMAYLHGPAGDPPHGHGHVHGHDRAHDHARGGASPNDHARGHSHPHAHEDESPHAPARDHAHSHSHEHRELPEILAIVEAADMSERAKATARRVFQVLAEAEAAAHGVAVDEVHFHEVGAVDSIVDVVAAAVCLDDLDVTDVVVPVLCEGQGTVRCQHGVIPVPVPAVVNVVAAHGIPYAATASIGYLNDFIRKVERARDIRGTRYIHVIAPCPTGWGCGVDEMADIAKDIVDTGLWYLAEYEGEQVSGQPGGRFRLNRDPKQFASVEAYLRRQGRFRALSDDEMAAVEAARDAKWEVMRREWRD